MRGSQRIRALGKALPVLHTSAFTSPRIPGIATTARLDRSRAFFRSTRPVLLVDVLLVVVIGATASFTIWGNRESALKAHQTDMDRIGIALTEQTSRFVQVIDLTLREVQSQIATLNVATPADFQRQLGTKEF